jgi:biotin/methionine sulfoxide reductase
MQRAIEPYGEARDDFTIFGDLAQRLGARAAFDEGLDETGWLRRIYGELGARLSARGIAVPPYDEFWRAGYLRLPEPAEQPAPFAAFRSDPQAHPLATPSGKIELFSATIAGFGYDDVAGHPAWREPVEWLGSPLAQRCPLHLVSIQPADKLHAQMDGSSESQAAKIGGRAVLLMHPRDASDRGLTDGAIVRAFNDRGACLAGLRISDAIRPGVVALPTGAAFDPLAGPDARLDKHGNPNALTRDIGTSRLSQGCAAQSCLIEVAGYAGVPPAVTAFEPPA